MAWKDLTDEERRNYWLDFFGYGLGGVLALCGLLVYGHVTGHIELGAFFQGFNPN